MKKCLYCSHVNEDEAKYCSACGNFIDTAELAVSIISRLNSQSSSEEIYSALMTVLRIGYEDSKKTNDEIKATWGDYKVKNPIHTSTQNQSDCCFLLTKSIDEFYNVSFSTEILQRFLLGILLASWQGLNPREFQNACNKIMDEFYKDIIKVQSTSLDRLVTGLVGVYKYLPSIINR